jgi:predicted methyltransferase
MRSLAAALALSALCLSAQVAKEANERYQTKEGREGMAKGLGSSSRDATQKPAELVKAMELKPGMTVADIGTGVGYMLPYLSRAVSPGGRVIAEDIFDDFLAKAKEKDVAGVEFVKGTERDPGLGENTLDVALALDSYHHYNYPADMLAAIHKAIKPGGRFVLVEYYRGPKSPGGPNHIRANQPKVIEEIQAAGFRLLEKHDHIKDVQYVLTFERP